MIPPQSVLLDVLGVRVEMPANQPLVMLKEADGNRYLPIFIGAAEAMAIVYAHQGVTHARPMTHDLFRDTLAAMEVRLNHVVIAEIKDGVFYATMNLESSRGTVEVSARPSDAIALALRTMSPVFATSSLLEEAAFEVADEEGAAEGELERFREFLDTVTPEDFEAGS